MRDMDERPDLEPEQRHIDHAYACLDAMRAHAAELLRTTEGGNKTVDEEILRWHLQERVAALGDANSPLVFGRIDEDDGTTFHIGRRHVRGTKGEAVVVDWRARVAAPFYRATIQDPMDVHRRRRFAMDGRTLVGIFDEYLDDPDSVIATSHGGVPDPLLAEIGRARTGQMRDIVATIQAEQDEIIRSPLKQLVIVQGGPGTGKTAIGLHRAAFLLYEHRDILEREKVLIVGPNRLFLAYISQVLPSLGETAAFQTTVHGLAVGYRARKIDPDPVARVKGDVRMAEVLRRAYLARLKRPTEDIKASVGGFLLRVDQTRIAVLMEEALGAADFRKGRARFIAGLRRLLLDRHELELTSTNLDPEDFMDLALRKGELEKQISRLWPNTGPEALVRRVLTSRAALAEAAGGLLTTDEMRTLQYRSSKDLKDGGWSLADIALLDEAEALVNGITSRYGHAIVDEAQDLSAMELRMIERRSRASSLTILGDLAQATTPASQNDWSTVLRLLGAPEAAEVKELSTGYRVPRPLMEFANKLLPVTAPGLRPALSIRETGDPPRIVTSSESFLLQDVEAEVRAVAQVWQSVGVICPEFLIDQLDKYLQETGVDFDTWERESIEKPVILLPPLASKGLEFDAVVVVEPALIMEEDKGARRLYVALTRAVQHLSIVHEASLPEILTS